jgi:hypothetical protein
MIAKDHSSWPTKVNEGFQHLSTIFVIIQVEGVEEELSWITIRSSFDAAIAELRIESPRADSKMGPSVESAESLWNPFEDWGSL